MTAPRCPSCASTEAYHGVITEPYEPDRLACDACGFDSTACVVDHSDDLSETTLRAGLVVCSACGSANGVSQGDPALGPPSPEVLGRLHAMRLLATANDPEQRERAREQSIANARAIDAAAQLVSDWQANGNSRELGDPRAEVWHQCASQLLALLNTDGGLR